jgi:hypothetical protein
MPRQPARRVQALKLAELREFIHVSYAWVGPSSVSFRQEDVRDYALALKSA